jgi:beta-galactosidase
MVSKFNPKPLDRPAVLHEFGDYYDSLPDIESINKFTGVIHPDWLENKKQWVTSNKLQDSYPDYLKNSIHLQQIGRKFQIERARTQNWVTGYDYWLLVDYPAGSGEGDAWEEGWLDYFWRPKVSPAEGRELNSAVLPMIDTGLEDRTLWNGGEKKIRVSISNYGDAAIENGVLSWTLNSDGKAVDAGEIPGVGIALGAVSHSVEIVLHAPAGERPHKLQLVVNMKTQATTYSNRWSFWSFPKTQLVAAPTTPIAATADLNGVRQTYPWLRDMPENISPETVLITGRLTEAARVQLRHGGRVIWTNPSLPTSKGVPFLPASGGAVGTLIQQSGPLREFPNEGFCDLQCFNLLDGATPISLDAWPTELTPVIGAIRTKSAFLSTQKDLSRTGYIVEVNAGGGKLLVTAPGMWKHLDSAHPEVVYLFDQLLRYASSDSFAPKLTIPDTLLNSLQTAP